MKNLLLIACVLSPLFSSPIHSNIDGLLLKGQFEKAEKEASEYLQAHPKDPEAYCALACTYRNWSIKSGINVDTSGYLKKNENAKIDITRENFGEVFSGARIYEPKLFQKSENLYLTNIAINPGHKNSYFNLMHAYIDMHRYADLLDLMDVFIANKRELPFSERHLMDFFNRLYSANETGVCEKVLEKVVSNYPGFADAIGDLGSMKLLRGDVEGAEVLYKKAIAINSNDFIVLQGMANVAIVKNQFELAARYSKQAFQISKNTDFLYTTGLLLYATKSKDAKSVLGQYLSMEAAKSNEYRFQITRDILGTLEDFDKKSLPLLPAIANFCFKNRFNIDSLIFLAAYTNIPGYDVKILSLLAGTYDRMNLNGRAIETLLKIAALNSLGSVVMDPAELNYNLGRNYYGLKDYGAAIKSFSQNKIGKRKIDSSYAIAQCHIAMNEQEKAIPILREISELTDKDSMKIINQAISQLETLKK